MAARTSLRVKSFMQQYSVKAENFSQDSENRIHSDDIAQKYGFSGALVPGVAIYGHLTYPLVEEFGQLWLDQACNQVRLFKPTYHGDILTFTYIDGPEKQTVNCDNQTVCGLPRSQANLIVRQRHQILHRWPPLTKTPTAPKFNGIMSCRIRPSHHGPAS